MKGRPLRGAVCGFLFGFFLSVFLLTIGVLPLDSILVIVLPVLFLVLGVLLGVAAPFKRDRLRGPAAAPR